MKYHLSGMLCTDNDFSIDVNNSDAIKRRVWSDGEDWYFDFSTDNPYEVRDFLQDLIVSYRVGKNHYWVIEELYHMTVKVKNAIWDDSVMNALGTMSGNYSGTEISLTKEATEKDIESSHWIPYEPDENGNTNIFRCSACEKLVWKEGLPMHMFSYDYCPYCGTKKHFEKKKVQPNG